MIPGNFQWPSAADPCSQPSRTEKDNDDLVSGCTPINVMTDYLTDLIFKSYNQ